MQQAPVTVSLGFDSVKLPGSERMGLLGASYTVELAPGWWVGPAVYGAATGRRGGLFNWGAEGQRRWRLGERWQVVAGVYAGGGGGAGAPVGGGLMLRPHADLMFGLGGWATGITASQVRFPHGEIHSAQLGVVVTVTDKFAFVAPGHGGEGVRFSGAGGVGADRLHTSIGRYAMTSTGAKLGYVGIALERQLDPHWSAIVETHAAAQGQADGYADVLGGVLALWPLGRDAIRFGVHAAIGLGGGGAIDTGGGRIAKLAAAGRLRLSDQLSLDLEAGRTRAVHGRFDSRYAQLSLGIQLGEGATVGAAVAPKRTMHDMEWALSLQAYSHAQRKDGSQHGMGTLGLKFSRAMNESLYLTGQAHSTITGEAGGYSAALIGLGAQARLSPDAAWRIGAEGLVGAAGGGGVSSQGGAVAQAMVWAGRDLGRFSRLKVGLGQIRSLRGELSSPVIDLAWAVAFGVP